MITKKALAIAVLALMGWAKAAAANVILEYQGKNFDRIFGTAYSTSDSVSGWIELAAPLPANAVGLTLSPIAFSFTDGQQTFTDASPLETAAFTIFATDASGLPVDWRVLLIDEFYPADGITAGYLNVIDSLPTADDLGGMITCLPDTVPNTCRTDRSASHQGAIEEDPGVWSYRAAVPEPATLTLLAAGLGGLAFARRRRRKAA